MSSGLGVLLVAAVSVAGGYGVFVTARKRASQSAGKRKVLIVANATGVVLGLYLALGLPRHVPETSGSPASLVAVLFLWFAGGMLAALGLPGLLGAWFATPESGRGAGQGGPDTRSSSGLGA